MSTLFTLITALSLLIAAFIVIMLFVISIVAMCDFIHLMAWKLTSNEGKPPVSFD